MMSWPSKFLAFCHVISLYTERDESLFETKKNICGPILQKNMVNINKFEIEKLFLCVFFLESWQNVTFFIYFP